MHLLAEIGNGELLVDMFWIFMFVIWFWLLIVIFGDIFRSHDLGGFGKTLWILFVIITPYLGIFVYLIARGKGMQGRQLEAMKEQQAMQAEYIKSVAGANSSNASEELARLSDLKDKGVLSEEEFASAKAKVLS